jgi:hypothetical protein
MIPLIRIDNTWCRTTVVGEAHQFNLFGESYKVYEVIIDGESRFVNEDELVFVKDETSIEKILEEELNETF